MTQLPFEDLPEKPDGNFDDFWYFYPRKTGKRKARAAYAKALKRASHADITEGVERYKANKPAYCDWMHPTTFLNGDHWEDEYDSLSGEPFRPVNYTPESLAIIAAYVLKPYYDGRYSRETLQACVDADLITAEQMEDKL